MTNTIEQPLAADDEPGQVDTAWREALAQRVTDLSTGRVELISEDVAERQIDAIIAKYL